MSLGVTQKDLDEVINQLNAILERLDDRVTKLEEQTKTTREKK